MDFCAIASGLQIYIIQQCMYVYNCFVIVILQDKLSELKNKFHTQKEQLGEKSHHLSTREASLDEFQESLHFKEEKVKTLGEENVILKKQLENLKKEQSNLEQCNLDLIKELSDYEIQSAEKDKKNAELKDEINILSAVYAKAINESKQSPQLSEQTSGSQIATSFVL